MNEHESTVFESFKEEKNMTYEFPSVGSQLLILQTLQMSREGPHRILNYTAASGFLPTQRVETYDLGQKWW